MSVFNTNNECYDHMKKTHGDIYEHKPQENIGYLLRNNLEPMIRYNNFISKDNFFEKTPYPKRYQNA